MWKMKAIVIVTYLLLRISTSASAQDYTYNKFIFNGSFGIGTFSAGENLGGSAFLGSSLSVDWKPNEKTRLSYGLESGLLGGETQGTIIYGVPAIFRLGWHPNFMKSEKVSIFILAKTGWGFGIWNSQLEKDAIPNGIVGGINLGGRYFLSPLLDVYTELGYTYYGLARSSNHPEYPLGYGSGKIYTSLGLSLKIGKRSAK